MFLAIFIIENHHGDTVNDRFGAHQGEDNFIGFLIVLLSFKSIGCTSMIFHINKIINRTLSMKT